MHDDRISHPERTNATGAYSDGVLCDGWLYISGQGALDQKTGKIVEGSIEDQVRLTMKNVGQILEAAGCTFDDLVKCTCHLKNIEDFDAFDRVYAEHFPRKRPARTTVQSVLGEGMKVEIDGIARKNRGEGNE
jgi:2-iminobutanoate/2-iminopropanoate deaminase